LERLTSLGTMDVGMHVERESVLRTLSLEEVTYDNEGDEDDDDDDDVD